MTARERRTGRLHALVLRLYPHDLRRRYGPEILELLETSSTPIRDLADVARSGVRERAASAPARHSSRHSSHQTLRWMTTSAAVIAAEGAPLALSGTVPWAVPVVGAAVGLMLTHRCAARLRPTLLVTSGLLFIYLLPHLWESVSGEAGRAPELVSTVAFGVALALAAPLLRRRPGHRTTVIVGAFAVLALPSLATTLLAALGHLAHPWQSYWLVMSSYAPPAVDGALVYYPVLYTCCAFMLLACLAPRNRPVPLPEGHNLHA